MIIPSIDLRQHNAVQLVGGREEALNAGDPRPLATRFGRVGEVAVIDLDAALGSGDNRETVGDLLALAPCRVGGGIRDVASARRWLDLGAHQVILGTAAEPEILSQLPAERLIAALDAVDGEVVVDGWRTKSGRRVEERMAALRQFVGGFLVTFVEREGRMQGIDLARAEELQALAKPARLTVAGGVKSVEEIAALDRLGIDAQVGMALYTGRFTLADAFAAPLRSDRPDGLWPTVVSDTSGVALGLVYSDRESLALAIETGRGVYHSRSRGLWVKGEESGATQTLLRIDVDCDRDALRFVVRQHGSGFCHSGAPTCFGPRTGLEALASRLAARVGADPASSYTARLLANPGLLKSKLVEEAAELAAAPEGNVVHEAADLIYFALVAMTRAGVSLDAVAAELDARGRAVTRRFGAAKRPS